MQIRERSTTTYSILAQPLRVHAKHLEQKRASTQMRSRTRHQTQSRRILYRRQSPIRSTSRQNLGLYSRNQRLNLRPANAGAANDSSSQCPRLSPDTITKAVNGKRKRRQSMSDAWA